MSWAHRGDPRWQATQHEYADYPPPDEDPTQTFARRIVAARELWRIEKAYAAADEAEPT